MGTTYQVKVIPGTNTSLAIPLLKQKIDEGLAQFNQSMSTYIGDSELSSFNQSTAGDWVSVSDELFEVLSLGQRVARESSGAFDVTVGPLVNAWGFGPKGKLIEYPTDEEIIALSARVGWDLLVMDDAEKQIKKHADLYVDLSAIAKGYAADVIAGLLSDIGFENYMVEIGGELFIAGLNPKGKSWIIGVEKPSLEQTGSLQAVTGDRVGIATSGDYRNYYEQDGVRVSHTINPKTGKPITHRLASVTVISESAGLSDAYATAINVLGPEAGFELAQKKNLAVFFIIRDNGGFNVKYTSEFERYMVTK